MKKRTLTYLLSLSLMLMSGVGMVHAQTDKKAAEIKKLEAGLHTARANVAKQEKALAKADSLVRKGAEQMNESRVDSRAIATEWKTLDKEHAAKAKALGKLASSKDKEEAARAKADLKVLETKYRADTKALDLRMRDATKKSTTGSANLAKGKSGKKTAADALITAQVSMDLAQAKYDVATGAAEPADQGRKKK